MTEPESSRNDEVKASINSQIKNIVQKKHQGLKIQQKKQNLPKFSLCK
jgi:hypothetical protein